MKCSVCSQEYKQRVLVEGNGGCIHCFKKSREHLGDELPLFKVRRQLRDNEDYVVDAFASIPEKFRPHVASVLWWEFYADSTLKLKSYLYGQMQDVCANMYMLEDDVLEDYVNYVIAKASRYYRV